MTVGPATASDSELAPHLRSAVARLSRGLRRTRAGAGLTPTETTVLATTVRKGPLGLSRLADEEGMNPTMLSRVVRRLEEAGLLERREDPDDRRAALVEASAPGVKLYEEILSERLDALDMALGRLGAAERATLQRALPVLERVAGELKADHR